MHLRWFQELAQEPDGYKSCWGLDNILLVNMAHKPTLLEDNMDPLDTANWFFFPGATIKVTLTNNEYQYFTRNIYTSTSVFF